MTTDEAFNHRACCLRCRYYFGTFEAEVNGDGVFYGMGECHRRAPVTPAPSPASRRWPEVSGDEWCGEYEGVRLTEFMERLGIAEPA